MFIYIISVVLLIIVLYIYKLLFSKRLYDLKGKHVLITGGSKGIGYSLAVLAVESGANLTIIARDSIILDKIKMDLLKKCCNSMNQKVITFSIDVSNDYFGIEKTITEAEAICGPIYLLVCCAGTSISDRFEDTPIESFKRMIDINYLGTVHVIKACLPSMKSTGNAHIVLFSSIAGLFGLFGYSAYSPSKFAIVGLAQVLAMELKSYNIKVTVSYPPDTDTEGFANEQINKPIETKVISESGGLYSPEVVAKQTLNDALSGNFSSTVGFESWMIRTVCSGMSPITSYLDIISQVLTMGIFRIAAIIFLRKCDSKISECAKQRQSHKKSN